MAEHESLASFFPFLTTLRFFKTLLKKEHMVFYSLRKFLSPFSPFPNNKILDSSKLKKFADDNFKLDDNGIKFSKQVENTVGKGEITCYEQFLLFHSVFRRLVLQTRKNQGLFGKRSRNDKMFGWSK